MSVCSSLVSGSSSPHESLPALARGTASRRLGFGGEEFASLQGLGAATCKVPYGACHRNIPALCRCSLYQPWAPALEIFFFCLSKENNFLTVQQLGLQTWHLFRAAVHKSRKLVLKKLGEENVLELPEIDVEAAFYASSVLAFRVYSQGMTSVGSWGLQR